jgi:hypothetical protein
MDMDAFRCLLEEFTIFRGCLHIESNVDVHARIRLYVLLSTFNGAVYFEFVLSAVVVPMLMLSSFILEKICSIFRISSFQIYRTDGRAYSSVWLHDGQFTVQYQQRYIYSTWNLRPTSELARLLGRTFRAKSADSSAVDRLTKKGKSKNFTAASLRC